MLTAAGCRNESAPAEQAAVPAATTPIVTTTTVKPVNIEGLDLVLAGIHIPWELQVHRLNAPPFPR